MVDVSAPYVDLVVRPTPTVATDFTISVPGDESWRVLSLVFQFVTDANVASRAVRLVADDGTSIFYAVEPETNQAAGLTRRFTTVNGAGPFGGVSEFQPLAWPDTGLWLRPGWRLRTITSSIQAGDQYSAIVAQVQIYPNAEGMSWLPSSPYRSPI